MKGYKFTTMPIAELVCPTKDGYFFRMSDRYWVVTNNEEVLFYGNTRSPYHAPQCNLNDAIASRFRTLPERQGIIVIGTRLIPVAFRPIRIQDYQE